MSQLIEWLPPILFLALVAASMAFEVRWLTTRGWSTAGRAIVFVLISNLLPLLVGGFIIFTVIGVLFMMVMGPSGEGSNIGDTSYIIVILIGLVTPMVLFISTRRLMLLVLKIRTGSSAWLYSLISSLAVALVVLVPPPFLWYITSLIWTSS